MIYKHHKHVLLLFVELSDSSSDSNVIIVSDSDESEDELECLMSLERPKQQQHDSTVTDQYAAAVATVFLNTTSKTAQIPSGVHDSSVVKLATDVVREEHGSGCSSEDGHVTESVSDELNEVASSVLLSTEHDTCARPENDIDFELAGLQPTQSKRVSEANEAVDGNNDYIASELIDGLDSTACSELTDCLDPIGLLSADNCATLDDVCNVSFLGDLSFINECLVDDCASSELLGYQRAANDVLSDIQLIDVDDQSSQLNKCSSEIIDNYDISSCVLAAVDRSAGLVQMPAATGAADNDDNNGDDDGDDIDADNSEPQHSEATCQHSLLSYSQTNADTSSVIVSDAYEHVCKRGDHVDNDALLHRTSPVSASVNASSLCAVNQQTSERQQTVNSDLCQSYSLDSVDLNICMSMHLDYNANELMNLTAIDTANSDKLSLSSAGVEAASENVQVRGDVSATEIASDENLPSTATRKHLLSEELSHALCKRFRAENDCLTGDWWAGFDGSTHGGISDTCVVSTATDTNVSSSCTAGSDEDGSLNSCCSCCKLPCVLSSLLYCTDGHACCQTCLQHQVKRLLSTPSKACSTCIYSSSFTVPLLHTYMYCRMCWICFSRVYFV